MFPTLFTPTKVFLIVADLFRIFIYLAIVVLLTINQLAIQGVL